VPELCVVSVSTTREKQYCHDTCSNGLRNSHPGGRMRRSRLVRSHYAIEPMHTTMRKPRRHTKKAKVAKRKVLSLRSFSGFPLHLGVCVSTFLAFRFGPSLPRSHLCSIRDQVAAPPTAARCGDRAYNSEQTTTTDLGLPLSTQLLFRCFGDRHLPSGINDLAAFQYHPAKKNIGGEICGR
jgi:hypothetical protein